MSAALANIATLDRVEKEGVGGREWISPIGRSIADDIAEHERFDPEYKKEREESRPYRELRRIVLIRRTELGISQRELARRMGTSGSVISRLERGDHNLSMETMRKLAGALGLELTIGFGPRDENAEDADGSLIRL